MYSGYRLLWLVYGNLVSLLKELKQPLKFLVLEITTVYLSLDYYNLTSINH